MKTHVLLSLISLALLPSITFADIVVDFSLQNLKVPSTRLKAQPFSDHRNIVANDLKVISHVGPSSSFSLTCHTRRSE